jgi:serine/threonine-protein kinase
MGGYSQSLHNSGSFSAYGQQQQSQQPQQHQAQGGPPSGAGPFTPRDLKPSQIETALSVPRPDPAAVWMAQQAAARPMGAANKGTAVLVAVAILTAICVLALGAILYMKVRSPPSPAPPAGQLEATPADAARG